MKKLIVLMLMLFSTTTVFASKNEVVSSKLYGMWEVKSSDKTKKTLLLITKSSDASYRGAHITIRKVNLSDYSKKDTNLQFSLIKRGNSYYLIMNSRNGHFIKIVFTNSRTIKLIDLGSIDNMGKYNKSLFFLDGATAVFKKKINNP